jgi:hypothetical protein
MGKAALGGQPSDPPFAQGRDARFIDENGGGLGVRLRKPAKEKPRKAKKVEDWLKGQPAGTRSPEEVARMSPAQRLDYSRQFDQSKLPGWKDPRAKL